MSVETSQEKPPQTNYQFAEQLQVERLEDHFPTFAWEFADRAIHLVRADLNPAGTFKWRGAELATRKYKELGYSSVATVSAGNHASGIVLAALRYAMEARIFLPTTTPHEKIANLERMWSDGGGDPERLTLISKGQTLEDAFDEYVLSELRADEAFIHPYDDEHVIEGQGTLLPDIYKAVPDMTHIITPAGGWGLVAGLVLRAARDKRDPTIIGAVPNGSNSMALSIRSDSETPVEAWSPNKRYGGAAVRYVGHHALRILRAESYAVHNIEIAYDEGIRELAADYENRSEDIIPLEPTSLLAIQALRQCIQNNELPKEAVITVVGTGHNEDYRNLLTSRANRFPTISGYIQHTPPSRR